MTSNNCWSMTEGVFNCLIDDERTRAYCKAITNTVHPGDVVVDMGTGSGVLAMLAARICLQLPVHPAPGNQSATFCG